MEESKVVYIIGAGLNRVISNLNGLKPPLIKDFFKLFLECKMFQNRQYQRKIKPLFNWIETYWKKSIESLQMNDKGLNLEDVFTIIQLYIESAISTNNLKDLEKYDDLNFILKAILVEFLNQFHVFASNLPNFRRFGEIIYNEKPNIITFNYDSFLERVIEGASEFRMIYPDFVNDGDFNFKLRIPKKASELNFDDIDKSIFNWNRVLSYDFQFDKLLVRIRGIPKLIDNNEFYSHPNNQLSDWRILKLHGSLDWFKHSRERNNAKGGKDIELTAKQKEELIYSDATWFYDMRPNINGIILDPLIITPVLYKANYYNSFPFNQIWEQAKLCLEHCKKLVIIGYSFAPTDFFTKKLVLDSFLNNELEELIIVNPDKAIVKKVINLTHFNKNPKSYNDLNEFLLNYGK